MLLFRYLTIFVALTLAACGFEPAYGPGGSGADLTGHVAIGAPSDGATYQLVRALETRLGRGESPVYDLGVVLHTGQERQAIDTEGSTERYTLLGHIDYELTSRTTGASVASGRVSSFTGYSASGTPVATLAARDDAQARLITILADQLILRLLAAQL